MAKILLSNRHWLLKKQSPRKKKKKKNNSLQYLHGQHCNNISLGMGDALLSPNPQEISTSLTLVDAGFSTHSYY